MRSSLEGALAMFPREHFSHFAGHWPSVPAGTLFTFVKSSDVPAGTFCMSVPAGTLWRFSVENVSMYLLLQ